MERNQCRNHLVWVVLTGAMFVCTALLGCSDARQPTHRVGVLVGIGYIVDLVEGLKDGMAEAGYVEGETVEYDVRTTEFDLDAYERIIREFIENDVDLIVSSPTEATIVAKELVRGTGIPVVFAFALVEGTGIVESALHPGGNSTGVRYPGPEVAGRRFEIMRKVMPDAGRFLVPYQRGYPNVPPQLRTIYPIAEASGVELVEMAAADAADLEDRLETFADSGESVDAVLFLAEPLTVNPEAFAVLGAFAAERNIPAGGAVMRVGDYRTIFGLNIDLNDCGRQAALLVDKVLDGASAGTIPVVSAENYFSVDCTAAEELGISIPIDLISQADEVIH